MKIFNQPFIDLIIILSESRFQSDKDELITYFRTELRRITQELRNLQIPESQKSYLTSYKLNKLQIELEARAKFILDYRVATNFVA